MYSFELSEKFLSAKEQSIFDACLTHLGLDKNIWQVFASLFRARLPGDMPMILRIFENEKLCGALIVVKCTTYGKALFSNKLLSGVINFFSIPYIQWIKFGCCMDMMSNPGFVKDPNKTDEVLKNAIDYLGKNFLLTIITDYDENKYAYTDASILPALPHALIDCSGMHTITDYTRNFKNIKRKIKRFENKGGKFILQNKMLNGDQLKDLKKCFISTTESSVFYLPYQELYLNAALKTSKTEIDTIYYFIATINDEFVGYQAAIKTGKYLNALHGAFDRNRVSNYHAYDILFVKMTEFAIQNGLELCDFGAVLNYTKQKMVNSTKDMSYFILSKYLLFRWIFRFFLKLTKVQSKKQLTFR
jgi:hypothetical protein